MSATASTLVRQWRDEPAPGRTYDEWPYPTTHTQYLITGELAERVKRALGESAEAAVFITEDTISTGYSEYTQETELQFTVECGARTVTFDEYSAYSSYGATTVARLSLWLDKAEGTA